MLIFDPISLSRGWGPKIDDVFKLLHCLEKDEASFDISRFYTEDELNTRRADLVNSTV